MLGDCALKGPLAEHRSDIAYQRDIFSCRPGIVVNYCTHGHRLLYKTSLEREKHEKQGPEVRYRIYLDDLDRF